MVEQGVEHAADEQSVCKVVVLLFNGAGDRPLLRHLAVLGIVIPDVPLVERQTDMLVTADFKADLFADGGDLLNELAHLLAACKEIHDVALMVRIILMERQIVDVGIALAEDLLLPSAEGRHRAVGAAAGDGLNGRVEHLHELGRLAGDAAVFRGRLRADLPGAVHLVAEAPELDVIGGFAAVFAALVRPVGVHVAVAVFQQFHGVLRGAGAEVHGHHRLRADALAPLQEFIRADLIRLNGAPSHVRADGTLVLRTDAVAPVVAGQEVAARIADLRDMQRTDELFHVAAEAEGVGSRVARLIDAGIDSAAEMLDE